MSSTSDPLRFEPFCEPPPACEFPPPVVRAPVREALPIVREPVAASGAQILVDALLQEGVDTLFGYPGGSVIAIFDELSREGRIRTVLVRHEQAAAHAADGYARSTGRVGVCLATSGPGATNLVTGIATAHLDSVPMVAITGQVRTANIGTDAFQEADIVGITRPVTKHNYLVDKIADLPRVLKEAFYLARSGRPGPVLVDIPVDVTLGCLDTYVYPESVSIRGYKPNYVGHPRQIAKAAEEIKKAKCPLIVAGGGVIHSGAHAELRELCELTNIPVTTTLMGLGCFPVEHPLFVGMPGMHGTRTANACIVNCDLLVSIGMRFDDRVTGDTSTFASRARIVHIDIDPAAISKVIDVHVPVVGDAKQILRALNLLLEPRQPDAWNAQVSAWKEQYPLTYRRSDDEIAPQAVVEELSRLTGGDAIIATEVGQNQMWAANFYKYKRPRQLLSSGGLGTMGFGMPAAMGAALGNPGALVVDVAGDGSIQMNIQELATIRRNNIPVKVVILNNGYLGMVRQWQELFWQRNYASTCLMRGSDCPTVCDKQGERCRPYVPDFMQLAAAYGIPARRAYSNSDVADVLREGLRTPGPYIMEFLVRREENVFPMVPSGKSVAETIVES